MSALMGTGDVTSLLSSLLGAPAAQDSAVKPQEKPGIGGILGKLFGK